MKRRERFPAHEHDPLVAFDRCSLPTSRAESDEVWLGDAMRINPPSWLEAVAIVQGVSNGLGAAQMPPMVAEIAITSRGEVRFPPGGVANHVEIVEAQCRLLERMIGSQLYPMDVWVLIERARTAPSRHSAPGQFAAALGRLAPLGGPARLAAYVLETAALRHHPTIAAAARGPQPWFLRRFRSSPD